MMTFTELWEMHCLPTKVFCFKYLVLVILILCRIGFKVWFNNAWCIFRIIFGDIRSRNLDGYATVIQIFQWGRNTTESTPLQTEVINPTWEKEKIMQIYNFIQTYDVDAMRLILAVETLELSFVLWRRLVRSPFVTSFYYDNSSFNLENIWNSI